MPVFAVADLAEVKAFANHLHSVGKQWSGKIFGWQAEYTPESERKPVESNMTFTPADFRIGESGIWFFSLMWEHGKDNDPVEFLDDRGIIEQPNTEEPHMTGARIAILALYSRTGNCFCRRSWVR
jgi:hypothetical protein